MIECSLKEFKSMFEAKNKRKVWDEEQDRILIEHISVAGPRLWDFIALSIKDRTGK